MRVIDIFHDQPVGVAKARLAADRGHLDRLQLLGARLLKHGKNSFQSLDLDGQRRVASKGRRFSGCPAMTRTDNLGEEIAASSRPFSG